MFGFRLHGHFQNLFEIVERRLRLAVHVDNITQFLQRAENEKRIDEERKELADRDSLRIDQVEHQKQNRGPEKIDEASLNETYTAKIADLFEFQFEDLVGSRI